MKGGIGLKGLLRKNERGYKIKGTVKENGKGV